MLLVVITNEIKINVFSEMLLHMKKKVLGVDVETGFSYAMLLKSSRYIH